MKIKEFTDSINYTKKPLLDNDEKAEKLYPAYLVNKNFSNFTDTIFYANEMNCFWELDKKMQFDFLRLGIRKKKRFCPWTKRQNDDDVELIKQAYGYNNRKAEEVLNILGPGDLDKIRQSLELGGINSKE